MATESSSREITPKAPPRRGRVSDGGVGPIPAGEFIYDNLHGNIHLEPLHLKFIDTEQFQRLRHLKQLGVADMIFPGAVHSRFEHSLGVYSLAAQTVDLLQKHQGLELGIDRFDVKAVKLAGLLHNIGHAPFNHLFEREFLPRVRDGLEWSHADMVKKMINYIVDEHQIDLDADLITRVEEMILASSKTPSSSITEKRFLLDIVANGRNGVDVDKFDYVTRDSQACGLGCGFEFQRLIETMQVMGDEICYQAKDYLTVHNMFSTHANLHRSVYADRTVKAVELMVLDALVSANQMFGISAHIDEQSNYWQLDDTIINHIETDDVDNDNAGAYGKKESRDIIQRIRRRNLYKFCNEFVVPKEKLEHIKNVTAEEIVCSQKSSEKALKPEDVVVSYVRNDLAHIHQNPLENIHFFQDDSTDIFDIPNDWVSQLPAFNQDTIVRVYSKKPELVGVISEAFENCKLKLYGTKTKESVQDKGLGKRQML